MSKGTYDIKREIFTGNDFKGTNKDTDITSSLVKYFTKENRIEFGERGKQIYGIECGAKYGHDQCTGCLLYTSRCV